MHSCIPENKEDYVDENHPLRSRKHKFSERDRSLKHQTGAMAFFLLSLIPHSSTALSSCIFRCVLAARAREQTQHLQRADGSQASPRALSLAPSLAPALKACPHEREQQRGTAEPTASAKQIPASEPGHSRPGFASEGKQLNSPTAALPSGKMLFLFN